MDVGLELRQARERRGCSLLQLSRITKISPRVLEAIETCDDTVLPAPVFTRSFVRTYAAEVKLDPDDTLRRYMEQFESPEELSRSAAAAEPEASAQLDHDSGWRSARVLYGRFGTATVLVLAGITVLALAGRNYKETQPNATAPATAGGAAPAAPEAQPVATSGVAATPADRLQLTIAPTGPCWVQAIVNGERVFATELKSGDRRLVDAPSDVTLRVGDPATFEFSINGKPAKVPGAPGQAVTVQITRENYSQFLLRS
jgi:cytoskeletal protein RodZ